MNIRLVHLEVLKDFAETINHCELETNYTHKRFLFEIDNNGFYFTPASSHLPRLQGYSNIEKFLERYNEEKC